MSRRAGASDWRLFPGPPNPTEDSSVQSTDLARRRKRCGKKVRTARLVRWAALMRMCSELEDAIREGRTRGVFSFDHSIDLLNTLDNLTTLLLSRIPR